MRNWKRKIGQFVENEIGHLSKIILEADGIYFCSNWLEIDIDGQNPISVLPSLLAISIAMQLRLSSTFFMTSEIAAEACSDVAWSGVLHSAWKCLKVLVWIGFHFFANVPWNGLQVRSWHVLPFGMRLHKRVTNGGSGSVPADWLIDCVGALFVCEFDLILFHLIPIRNP